MEDITRWRGYEFYVRVAIDILMTAFLTIFRRFPTTFRRFPKTLQNLSEGHTNVADYFRKFAKIAKDCRRLPKTFEEDPEMFRWYTSEFKYKLSDKFDISEIIDIFTSEDMENTPLEFLMWFRMNFTSDVFSSETPVSM